MRAMLALLGAILISGCQSGDPLSAKNDPKSQWWELAFTEPYYMKVWVEDSAVEDINGRLFRRTGGGSAAGGEPEDGTESARGWDSVGSSGKMVVGADLPKRIFVRWQSIVELQTYRVWLDIPEQARQLMKASTNTRCPETPEQKARYMASVYLGLAPGGVVQVWVRDSCSRPVKVAHAQAEVEPLGPSQGKNGGRYAYPVSEKSKRYINQYGIPYGSW
ncbi:hypothetical protein BK666_18210 [Pseudomonas frederiksbergensis]|uniref:DUF2931 domain-containing protein n=1 Tax=Pseudomonas frederiksbergensis TaxID=104087 RepID=A0A423K114_9PSED|nr:DUF2931 family protein [Pseudomonas frederiksbergensis]RON44347.1 hypothetical protein BK666_18210 [Pseudomonas frederiksbergensis]